MRSMNSSMQLTRAADYGVRVMVALARSPHGQRFALGELARATGSPESFLSKVLQELTKSGLISSRRGQSGGFEISERGLRAHMRDVIEAIDGPIVLNVCLSDGQPCARAQWCPAHPVWVRAQAAMFAVLESAKIIEMAATPAEATQGLLPELPIVGNGCAMDYAGEAI